jgi:hypothetical protein
MSINAGIYTIGTSVAGSVKDYENLRDFVNDIDLDIGNNTLTGIVLTDNDVGISDLILSVATSVNGLITIASSHDFGATTTPSIISSVAANMRHFVLDGNGNYIVEKLTFNGLGLEVTPTNTGVTERTTIIRRNYVTGTDLGIESMVNIGYSAASGQVKPVYFYDNVVHADMSSSLKLISIKADDDVITESWWENNVYIENNTFIMRGAPLGSQGIFRVTSNNSQYTYTIRNNVAYCEDPTAVCIRDWFPTTTNRATWKFKNCARAGTTSFNDGSLLTEEDCITTGVTSLDFLSTVAGNANIGKIPSTSDFFATGTDTGILITNTSDLDGTAWTAPRAMGAFSGKSPFDDDVMLLGPSTSDPIGNPDDYLQLNPTYDFMGTTVSERQEHRTLSGLLFTYRFREHSRFEIPETFVNSTHRQQIINWFNNNIDLKYIPRADTLNTFFSVRITGTEEPFSQYHEPFFENLYDGIFVLETT